MRTLYLAIDESGNFDFSPNGTKVLVLTCVALHRPFAAHATLQSIRYDLLEAGIDIEYFHAAEDRQVVRDRVFAAIVDEISSFTVYSVIIRKNRANPSIRAPEVLYPRVFDWLTKYAVPRCVRASNTGHVVICTDRIPVQSKRRIVEKAVKTRIVPGLPSGARYDLYHHDSKADLNLQIADYFSWAIYRKWNNNDRRSYDLIKSAIAPGGEGDLFKAGDVEYY